MAADAMIGPMDPETPQGSATGWDSLREAEWEPARGLFEAEVASNETAEALDGLGPNPVVAV